MIEKGVKEVRDHFTEYLKKVRKGEEIVVTERGKPVALLTPFHRPDEIDERLHIAATRGLVRLPDGGGVPMHKKIKLTGKSLTELILEERERGW